LAEKKTQVKKEVRMEAPVLVPQRPFVDDFAFDADSILIHNVKCCNVCSASVIDSAKFCTNCGIPMEETNPQMLKQLDDLRWKNTILEQKLHKNVSTESSSSEMKSSFPVAPVLASWDFTAESLYPALGSFCFNETGKDNKSNNSSALFNITEPAIFLDSANIGADNMINWALDFDQNYKREDENNLNFGNFPVFSQAFPQF